MPDTAQLGLMARDKQEKETKCREGNYDTCPTADKQNRLIEELEEVKKQLSNLQTGVSEIISLFEESKAVFKFFSRLGKFLRWIALTIASISAIWAAIVHWRPHS